MIPLYNVAYSVIHHLENSDKPVFYIKDKTLNGNQFRNMSINFALHMKKHGVTQDSCVALNTNNLIIATAFTIATGLIGACWIKATVDAMKNPFFKITHFFDNLNVEFEGSIEPIIVDDSWFKVPNDYDDYNFSGYKSIFSPALITHSSGTTGDMKYMEVMYAGFYERANNNFEIQYENVECVGFLFNPLKDTTQYKVMSLILNDTPLIYDLKYEDIKRYPRLSILCSHSQINGFLRDKEPPDTPFNAILDVGGAASDIKFLEKMFKYFKEINIGYGSTENGRTCNKRLYSILDFNGSSGFPFPDVEFKFENEAIFVKTPEYRTIKRYFDDLDDRIIEWYESGDLGYIKDGELYITGRSNDRINVGGIKVDPKLIENIVKTIDGVTDCMVYQDTNLDILEQMCIIVISDRDVSKQIYDRCVDGIGLAKTPKNIYYADELPINENGKASRKLAVEAMKNKTPISLTKYI